MNIAVKLCAGVASESRVIEEGGAEWSGEGFIDEDPGLLAHAS